ncbi:MAG: argininosuccinate synthase [Candidatus Brocadiae bacterium]|nr:argininosuccinate synthase [Candidatus Brocadiia bacterium]
MAEPNVKKAVLAYSGGLDTSVILPWLRETYGCEVVAFVADLGQGPGELDGIIEKAKASGASEVHVEDLREEFVTDYLWPMLKAGAVYEGKYLLGTSIARPLIAKKQVECARKTGADAVAHGATGKGNDQVRFEVTWACLFPQLKQLAPIREWGLSRDEEIDYAKQHGIPIPVDKKSPYSYDTNLWGKSAEAGPLEDPWVEPPPDVHQWTKDPGDAPDDPAYVEIGFERGLPVSLDGEALSPATLIARLNALAGAHGVGRIDMVENRLVGIKSRETYECPAAVVLLDAHRDLEGLCLERELAHYKRQLELKYAELVYYGLWYSPLRRALDAFMDTTQETLTGAVRIKLHKGTCVPVGRKSPHSLYRYDLATYDQADRFDHTQAQGFIRLWGLSAQIAEQVRREAVKE